MTQLLEFIEKKKADAVENGDEVDILYLDFCRAFDKVHHKRSLKKLYNYGTTGNIFKGMKEFLTSKK